ncbi:hypothetical protein KFK09_029111 [Dendrobium nobile]|uniref:DUF4283 domain-containing protein n=1 Tax=Dendrobium nobile TaxID=94219 RepID=A0A8T3A5C3_DENNO|nr:hypothetical protein KFK09_029111 [Dendrobium nobile]
MAVNDFPPLPSATSLASSSTTFVLPLWKNLLTTTPQFSAEFSHSLSFVPIQNLTAQFTCDQFNAGASEWSLSLVGYSIGKRPFYEALLSVIKKTWPLRGSLSLLTMDEGFFLLKFSAIEDYEHAWSGGPWFFFGKPFILQKWTPDFIPKREEFPSIPLWIKILNLPLSLWTPEGISKLASCVGIPIVVDALTAAKTRLTFARVCVQITSNSLLPDEIFYCVEGKSFPLRIQYDWKPERCSQCGSIMHPPTLCPKDPISKPQNAPKQRSWSTSRKPRQTPPPRLLIPKPPMLKINQTNTNLQPLLINPPEQQPSNSGTLIPNLNSPSGEPQEMTEIRPNTTQSTLISTKNKFDALNDHDENIDFLPHSRTHSPPPNIAPQQLLTLSNPNLSSPPHTSPRNHQPTIPSSTNDTATSSSTSSKTQQTTQQSQKQTRGKQAKKASTPNTRS